MKIKKASKRFLCIARYSVLLYGILFVLFSCEIVKLENTDIDGVNRSFNEGSVLTSDDTNGIGKRYRCSLNNYTVTLVTEKNGVIEERITWLNRDNHEQQGIFRFKKGLHKKSPAIIFIPAGGPTPAYTLTNSVIQKELINLDYVVFEFGKRGVIIDENNEIQINEEIYNTINPRVLYRDTCVAFNIFSTHPLVDKKRMAVLGGSESSLVAPMLANTYSKKIKCMAIISPVGTGFIKNAYNSAVENTIYYLLKYIDTDRDEFITPEEYENVNGSIIFQYPMPGMNPAFADLDINKDNKITVSEIETYMTSLTDFLIGNGYPDGPTIAWGTSPFTEIPFYAEPNYKRIARYRKPVLMIAGKDDRTAPNHNSYRGQPMGATLIKNYVIESGHKDFTWHIYDGLGHSLVSMTGKFNDDEYTNRGQIPQYVLDAFTEWFDEKLKY